MTNEDTKLSVSEFIAICNQELEYSFSSCIIEGEVSGFKVNQNKWVFFDLKDEDGSISCFMPIWDLRIELEDGMKVMVKGAPKITNWGKFSFTVRQISPVGEGSIKKSYELLKKKLEKEGLFDPAKKRSLPKDLTKIGVISSTGAAGYADFCKIINSRWGGLDIQVCHTQVQGLAAPDQIIRALNYLNEHAEVQVIAIIRGGGSADDLSCFNDELLARSIAASRIPVITGIGHEVDESLADLVADLRASTPSNCAEMLTKDRKAEIANLSKLVSHTHSSLVQRIATEENRLNSQVHSVNATFRRHLETLSSKIVDYLSDINRKISEEISRIENDVKHTLRILDGLNPEHVLSHGYAILSGKISPGSVVNITTEKQEITAEIKAVKERE